MHERHPSSRKNKKRPAENGSLPHRKKLYGYPAYRQNLIRIEWNEKRRDYRSLLTLIKRELQHLSETPMPANLKPMLASVANAPFNDAAWQFEIKWDGYRALAYLQNGSVELRSRNNLSFNEKYAPVREALMQWPLNAVVDGEIVILNENGKADFGRLQQWQRTGEGELLYYVFDLLWLEGYDLRHEPLEKRQSILKRLVPDEGSIRFSQSIDEWGQDFFAAARKNGLEGIIAKQKSSVYQPGFRTKSWRKIKIEQRHEAVICGYTKNPDTDRLFSSLILGVPQDGKLRFIGQVGTGFPAAVQRYLFKKMNPLFTQQCPFDEVPFTGAPTMWVKPELICEVKYTERTGEGLLRHPSFQGLREDKTIADFNDERQQVTETEKQKKKKPPST